LLESAASEHGRADGINGYGVQKRRRNDRHANTQYEPYSAGGNHA
jgi:hypothetical protein